MTVFLVLLVLLLFLLLGLACGLAAWSLYRLVNSPDPMPPARSAELAGLQAVERIELAAWQAQRRLLDEALQEEEDEQ